MSEADRVFPARKGQGARTSHGDRRLVLDAPRRGGPGGGRARVVEVVHVRREGSGPVESGPRAAGRGVRAETWPEGFRARPAQPLPPRDTPPVAPEPTSPAVHVMPMWAPSPPRPAPPAPEPAGPPAGTVADGRCGPRTPKAQAPKGRARRYADPFAEGDDGANCLRCGYLVEPARERRGLLTCAACGRGA
jgi:hypothetical protein